MGQGESYVRSHAKAASSGSSTRRGSRPGALTTAAAFALVFVAFLGIGASAALADNTPSVVTNAAESVGVTTAKLSGSVNPNGEAGTGTTVWRLEYTPAGAGSWATANSGEITGTEAEEANPVAVEAIFGFGGELHPGGEYEFRLVAENGAGQATSSTRAFTMQPATAPLLTANAADAVEYTTATLHGELDPAGGNENVIASEVLPIHWQLQYSLAGQGSWSTGGEGMIENAEAKENGTPIALSAPLSSGTLQPGSEYESRLVAFYASPAAPLEEASSPGPAFTTLDVTAPTVSADAASAITASSAKFTGTVTNGNSDPAFNSDCKFEYVTDAQFNAAKEGGFAKAQSIACQPNPVEGAGATVVEAEATGLEPHQTYHLRLSATNAGGTTTDDAPSAFTTGAVPPSVQTIYVGNLHATSATLRGWVNPHNSQTSYYFLWGTEDCSANPCQAIPVSEDADAGSGGTVVAAHQVLTGLSAGTTYHYVLVASNSAGTEEALDRSFTTAASDQGECPNEARRVELHATVLGNCRAWELASPGTSSDVMADSGRTVAATTESPGLPMAAKFSSVVGSADSLGSGIAFDYLAQRDGAPGTAGWNVHALTPPQQPLSAYAGGQSFDPLYEYFSPDLSRGIFRSWSSLPGTSANAFEVPNLYLRDDLRSPGTGNYQLLSDSAALQPSLTSGNANRPWFAGASADMQHVLFETKLNLTADASGANVKLYKSDDGVVRLVRANSGCAGQGNATNAASPCSVAGLGAGPRGGGSAHYTPRVISVDGSRVNFSSPYFDQGSLSTRAGAVSKLYQLDDQGTSSTADDALVQLSMSENSSPEAAKAAIYDTASTDGNRVFFHSTEQLTEAPGSGLYMWERQSEDETQELNVDAAGGSFTLTVHTQPSYGEGELSEGSITVNMEGVASPGSFTVGQTISAPGIPAGTTITEVGRFNNSSEKKIVLSQAATENGTQSLTAGFQASTGSLPWNATATQVQGALEGLGSIGTGNVSVSGGPGAASPFAIEFKGALAGVNVMPLTTDAGGLTGGASTATVTTANGIHNLTLLSNGGSNVLGASEDGKRVYFQIGNSIELWQDDTTPGGTLSFVATLNAADLVLNSPNGEVLWNFSKQLLSRVTPDGGTLLFEASDGSGLPPEYQHGPCESNQNSSTSGLCSEVYVYRADSSTLSGPDIVCASCNLSVPGAPGDTFLNNRSGGGASLTANHLSRALSDDGNRVFFDTDESLVEEDTNGVVDVYEYDIPSAEVHLISGGIDHAPSYLMDASADGSDVLFVTRAQLAGWDDDDAYDLYDARVAGGFANPPAQTAPCKGESCRGGGAPVVPATTAPGSTSLVGPGNPKGGRKTCPKGKRAVKKNGKTRCVKKHKKHAKHKRTANTNRRAGK
jgi:hypothetical protein